MSGGSLGTAAAIGGAIVTVALWAGALVGPVPHRARMPLALMSFVSAWAVCFLLMRGHFPKWAMVPGMAAVVISMVLLVAVAQMSLPPDGGGRGGEESDDGGGGTRPPDRPSDRGGPSEPAWWPEFERELERYVTERERTERGAPVTR